MNKPIKWPAVGSIAQKPHMHAVKAKPNPVIHSKPVYYRANGTGRDSYIETTSGGQFATLNATFDYRENFKKTLRSYDKCVSKHRGPRPLSSTQVSSRPITRNQKVLKSINDLQDAKEQEKIQMKKHLSVKPKLFMKDIDVLI